MLQKYFYQENFQKSGDSGQFEVAYGYRNYITFNNPTDRSIEGYVLILKQDNTIPRYKTSAFLHIVQGNIPYQSANQTKFSTSNFSENDMDLKDMGELENDSISSPVQYFNGHALQINEYTSGNFTNVDWVKNIWKGNFNIKGYLFNNATDYENAKNKLRTDSEIDGFQGGIEIKEDLYGAWINTLDSINYVSEKRNGTAYLKSNTDKAELLICYYDKQSIKILPNFKEIENCTYKIGASAIVNKPLWDGENFNTIDEYLEYFNFTQITNDINLTNDDFITVGEFNLPRLIIIQDDVEIGLINSYVVDNVRDHVLFNDLNVRILRFNSKSDFLKWRTGDDTIKFEEIDTNISPSPKDDDYNDIINLNDITLPTSNMNRLYRLTGSELLDLSMYLWNTDKTIYDDLIKNLELMGANPLDAIISIRLYPFLISRFCNLIQGTQINIGRASTGVSASRINATTPKLHICDFTLSRNYNDFKDYEPYTSYKLYLPYAQTIDLNPQGIYNVNISVDLIVDINTGMGEYVISYNNSPITFVNCKIGIEIPYSASQERINSSALLQSAMNVGVGALMGNEVGALLGGVKSAFEIRQNSNKFMNGGVGGSFINLINPQNVYLIKYHTPYSEPPNYNFQHGYPYERFNNINSLGGKVWIENPIVDDVPCTELERNEIVSLLQNGVQLD